MQMSGAEQQGQNSGGSFVHAETELAQQAERDQRGQDIHQNAGAVADDDAAYGWVVFISDENRPAGDPGGDYICGQHEQGLADAVPAEDLAVATVQAELGIFIGKHLRLRRPQPVCGLQAVHGVGGAQFAGLHDEGEQSCRQTEQDQRIAQPGAQARSHRLDGSKTGVGPRTSDPQASGVGVAVWVRRLRSEVCDRLEREIFMAKCSSCGTELSSAARFCLSCGKPVSNTDDAATISIDAAEGTAGAFDKGSTEGVMLNDATLDEATIDFATPRSPRPSRPPSRSPSSSSSRTSSSAEYLMNEGRFLPGRLVASRYRIIALLGKGGMGEVYRADDLTLGQAVAMKFLPDEAGHDEGLIERFRNEVRMARRVSHPNVCRVYDVGDVEGQTFFTMEYIDGEDLGSLLRRIGRLPPDKALDIARHLCAGLAAAHAKGVLHRDLKPANIMLDGRGQVVITDFGLAGVAEDIRGAEVRSGTPAYMSPEQLSGKEVSPRSDIYALGLVLYEVFTGKRAFAEKLVNSPKLAAAGVDSHAQPAIVGGEGSGSDCGEGDPALPGD